MSTEGNEKVKDIISTWSRSKRRQRHSRCYVYFSTEHPESFPGGQLFDDGALTFRTLSPWSKKEDRDLLRASNYARRWSRKVSDHRKALHAASDDPPRGYKLFQKSARIVKYLVKMCRISRRNVHYKVSQEDWLQMVDSFSEYFNPLQSSARKQVRPFVTLVPNERRELTQLSFDLSHYVREFGAEHLFTEDIRAILRLKSSERTLDQINELVHFFKRYCNNFGSFTLDVQRSLCQCMIYDKYEALRIITRQGGQADGMYICLSGTALEKTDESQILKEINPGEMFGEEDLKCACPRRGTVVTRATTEVVFIHSLDFRAIFNMSTDSNDPKYLAYCKDDIVFSHFPLQKLLANPSAWTVLTYKFGKLIVKDSNEMEWIYIITAGEARILKHMKTGQIDMTARRKETQQRKQQQNPFVQSRKLVDFIAQETTSIYKAGSYTPPNARVHRIPHSAFPHFRSHRKYHTPHSQDPTRSRTAPLPVLYPHTSSRQGRRDRTPASFDVGPGILPENRQKDPGGMTRKPRHKTERSMAILDDILSNDIYGSDGESEAIDIVRNENGTAASDFLSRPSSRLGSAESERSKRMTRASVGSSAYLESVKSSQHEPLEEQDYSLVDEMDDLSMTLGDSTLPLVSGDGKFIATANKTTTDEGKFSANLTTIPPFIQLESLHSGNVFGLRSCLEKQERGPSVSLVSAGCEVLQINKKFFMMHADDALLALIKVKHRAFPTEAELIDRLDANLQWQEFKERAVVNHLRCIGRQASTYTTPMGAVS